MLTMYKQMLWLYWNCPFVRVIDFPPLLWYCGSCQWNIIKKIMMRMMMMIINMLMINNNDFIEVGCTWCNQLHSFLLRWILVLLNGIWWKLFNFDPNPTQLPPTLNLNFIWMLNLTRNYEDSKENMNCDDDDDKYKHWHMQNVIS